MFFLNMFISLIGTKQPDYFLILMITSYLSYFTFFVFYSGMETTKRHYRTLTLHEFLLLLYFFLPKDTIITMISLLWFHLYIKFQYFFLLFLFSINIEASRDYIEGMDDKEINMSDKNIIFNSGNEILYSSHTRE